MKNITKILCCGFLFVLSACQTQTIRPAIVPVPEPKVVTGHSLGVIGAVEPVYILPMKTPFNARIDTGAVGSAIDVTDMHKFERDGEKWVSFVLVNDANGETHRFEKAIEKKVSIKRAKKDEKRVVVMMDIKIGNEIISAEFSLADREKFEYQALIGRNILAGRALVDCSISNTLH